MGKTINRKRNINRKVKRSKNIRSKRKSHMRKKTVRRKNQLKTRRKSMNRGRKSMKRGGFIGVQCGNVWANKKKSFPNIFEANNVRKGLKGLKDYTTYDIKMYYYMNASSRKQLMTITEQRRMPRDGDTCRIYGLKIKDIEKLRDDLKDEIDDLNNIEFSKIHIYGGVDSCHKRFEEIDDFFKIIAKARLKHFLDRIEQMGKKIRIFNRAEKGQHVQKTDEKNKKKYGDPPKANQREALALENESKPWFTFSKRS